MAAGERLQVLKKSSRKRFRPSVAVLVGLCICVQTAPFTAFAVNTPKPAPSSASLQPDASASRPAVIGNSDTKRYHLPGMPYYHQVEKYHRVYFNSEQEAMDSGYYKAGTGKDLADRKSQDSRSAAKELPPAAHPPAPAALPAASRPQAKPASHGANYIFVAACLLFMILLAGPFLPAILEIIRKKDADPLFISSNYSKDPRYFGKSYKQILKRAIAGLPAAPQISEVMLSKKESIQITQSISIPDSEKLANLLFVQGNLASGAGVHFQKEVYVAGDSDNGPYNIFRTLAAEGNVILGEATMFERWLDAEGDLEAGANCHLGVSAACGGRLRLGKGCSFRRLYGMPVATGKIRTPPDIDDPDEQPSGPSGPASSFIRKTAGWIEPESILYGDIIFLNDVRIGRHCVAHGSIKCYGDIRLEEHVTIHGNIFADGSIIIGRSAVIGGHIFSQNETIVSEDSVISRPDVIKSVLGKKSVRLSPNVTIYGYISTEGEGTVS